MLDGIPTGIGGNRRRWIRDQGGLSGLHGSYQLHKSRIRVAFYVELGSHHFCQVQGILVADVPLIGAGMHGNSLCAKSLTIQSHLHHIGIVGASCIPQSGDLVDIYT